MPDLADGESVEMKGSGSKPYVLKNTGGVYACTCPAWRNQSVGIERRTCKHLRKLRGDAAEEARLGGALPAKPVKENANGEEAAGPPILLAESWDNFQNLAGWWMSEKLDGVRAYWDGKQFLSRQGNLYHAPDWFTQGLPAAPLDGELWIGRKQFQRTVSIVRRQDKNDLWKDVRFLLFDAPGRAEPFEDRLRYLKAAFPAWNNPYCDVLGHDLCKGVDHLREELKRIETLGGEGLMLREPGSNYVPGRSNTLLKVKSFLDAEAVVIGHEPGKGKHAGRLGAVLARLSNGKTFSVGTGFSDHQRTHPPAIGTTITFRYQELSEAGIPRFPSYLRVRTDAAAIEVPRPIGNQPPVAALNEAGVTAPILEQPSQEASTNAAAKRRFEFSEDTTRKFWEIARDGTTVTTRWGKLDTAGQEKAKTFPTDEKAQKEYEKLIAEKTDKGYREQ